jgi:hypothetical protein
MTPMRANIVGLPFRRVVFGFRQFSDVGCRVAKRYERLALWQRDWFAEFPLPAHALFAAVLWCATA